MKLSNQVCILILILCGFALHRGGCTLIDSRPNPTTRASNVIDPAANPYQENFPANEEVPIIKTISGKKTLILPKAKYRIAGRVVSRRHYYMDWHSKLSPVDLAIAWGPMSTRDYDKYVSYKHTDRYYHYQYTGELPIDPKIIGTHSANEHLIPATPKIEKALRSIKIDEIVEIEGFLVNIEAEASNHEFMSMNSSLTREDSGPGACEIVYVTKVQIDKDIFR